MTRRFGLVVVVLLVVPGLLAACGSDSAETAEDYIEASLKSDFEKAEELECDSFEYESDILAAAIDRREVHNIDLNYDVGKGNNQQEVIVTGSFEVGEGDDVEEIELAASIRDKKDYDKDGDDDELIDTRIVLEMKKDGDDWCVEKLTVKGDDKD